MPWDIQCDDVTVYWIGLLGVFASKRRDSEEMVLDENQQIRREEESEEEPKEEQTLKKNVWYSQNTENKIKRKKIEFFFQETK